MLSAVILVLLTACAAILRAQGYPTGDPQASAPALKTTQDFRFFMAEPNAPISTVVPRVQLVLEDDEFRSAPPVHSFSVVTYNIYQMSRYLFPNWAQDLRIRRLLETKFIRNHDVIVFQEAWDGRSRQILLDGLKDLGYVYQTPLTGNGPKGWDEFGGKYCPACPYSGGVIIVSKWEITYKANWVFGEACGFDWFSNKGFAYVTAKLPFATVHLIGTHMQSDDPGCALRTPQEIRETQLREISEWLSRREIPDHDLVVIAGDLNIDRPWGGPLGDLGTAVEPPGSDAAEYETMLDILSARAAQNFDGFHATWDPQTNSIARHINATGPCQYLDHVVLKRGHENPPGMKMTMSLQSAVNIKTEPFDAGIIPGLHAEKYNDISDHYPVIFTVRWAAAA